MTSIPRPQPLEAHKYRLAFEQARDAMMFLDACGYLDCNPATLALFRVPDTATFRTTHPGIQLSPPYQPCGRPSPEAAQARIEEALHHGYAFFEWRHCTWDGIEFPSEVSLNRIDWEEQPVLMVIVRDISDRKRLEEELTETIRRCQQYEAAYSQSRDAIMMLDEQGFRDCNPATLTLFRVPSAASFTHIHPSDLSSPYQPDGRPSSEASAAHIAEAFRSGQAFFHWRHRTWDGQVDFPAEVLLSRVDLPEGSVLQAVVRDISERVAIETDLARKEAHYRLAQSSARFGIWEWDLAQGRIHWDSDCWAMLGYSTDTAETLTVDEWRSMIPDEDLARVEPEIAQKQAQGERFSIEHRCRHARGGWLWLQCRGQTAEFSEDGSPRRLIGTYADIDRLMRTELALRERVKEMETLTEVIRLSIDDTRSTEEMLHALARLIPQGWQHPERTAVRIRAQGREATSEPFFESGSRQVAAVEHHEAPVQVEVFQHEEGLSPTEPFLPQEQTLLEAIAEEIHQALRHRGALEALQEQATTDRLTGTFNRQHFEAELERALARTQRYGDAAALVMLDIDHFKAINDTFGHNAGDQILQQLTSRVNATLRREDLLGRWGGEEFLVLLPGNDGDRAQRTAERLRACIEAETFTEVGRVTISLGATALRPDDDTTTLLARVDQALYEAKTSGGRNAVATR
ncbi:MAG: diguanylate cyclase [Halorhodospira sp.]